MEIFYYYFVYVVQVLSSSAFAWCYVLHFNQQLNILGLWLKSKCDLSNHDLGNESYFRKPLLSSGFVVMLHSQTDSEV